jgi:hypothetical protein
MVEDPKASAAADSTGRDTVHNLVTACEHGYANAGWCATCYAVASDKVGEQDDLAKLRKTVAALAVTVDGLVEWQTDATRFLDQVHDALQRINVAKDDATQNGDDK